MIFYSYLVIFLLMSHNIPKPEDFFGHQLGADRKLAHWNRIVEYFWELDKSPMVMVEELGKSTERVQYERMDPAVQAVIDYKPNVNRLNRATTSSFNAQTSSLPNPALKRAADIVAKYEAGGAGYNAVNQGGEAGGTKIPAGFYSGDFRKMPQHGGRALTDMTVGEIMDLQADPGKSKMTNENWVKQGKLHAVGRYQFIGPTLKGLVQRLGISRDQKFTVELQDQLFLSLLKSGGLGQWVGPSNYATAEEKALIEQARSLL